MKWDMSRFAEVEVGASCKCGRDFIVITSSLLLKVFSWSTRVAFCPFCGEKLDFTGIKNGTPITSNKEQ